MCALLLHGTFVTGLQPHICRPDQNVFSLLSRLLIGSFYFLLVLKANWARSEVYGERWFSFGEIQTARWFTGLGVWFPLDPHLPRWKALCIIASKKWHNLHCIFICQFYSCSQGELGALDRESIRELNELLSVPRSVACLASGAATLYWGGKSETHPGVSPVASCWGLILWAKRNQTSLSELEWRHKGGGEDREKVAKGRREGDY